MDKIDAQLLTRYHQNACSAQERAAVEAWLCGEEELEIPDTIKLMPNREDKLEAEIWQNIQAHTKTRKNTRLLFSNKAWLKYAAAVLLPILLWPLANDTLLFQRVATLDNTKGIHTETFYYNDLKIELGTQSRCRVYSNIWGQLDKIDFDGAVSITNNDPSMAKTVCIASPDLNCKDKKWNDRVSLPPGESYKALIDEHCGLIAATSSELQDGLPIGVKTEIQKYFTL